MKHPSARARSPLTIGTAQAKSGEISYGTFTGAALPTGATDDLPVIMVQGKHSGPVLWLTAGVHGNEYTGIIVLHQLLKAELAEKLRGTIVAVPLLNPAGLRTVERRAYYYPRTLDPNRLFPLPTQRTKGANGDPEPPSILEEVYAKLFEVIASTADYLIDLHNYTPSSLPFAFRDPIGYTDERDKAHARQLQLVIDDMLDAFGHTVINEYATTDYLKRNLHRSVSGAVLNTARIPAFTVELGSYLTVDPAIVTSAAAGLRNVMRWANMLTGTYEPITGVPVLKPNYPIRRMIHPYAPQSGLVRFLVQAGEQLEPHQPIGQLTDIYGRPLGSQDGLIRSQHAGFVLGIMQGASFYRNEPLLSMAVPDDREMLVQF